jgi:DNA-binding transcriptional MerR regulator
MDFSIGELARRSGLTVRALHHYERLGLLRASARTAAGYRRYGDDDVLRLHRLLALREAGLALKDIAPMLDGDAPPLAAVLAQQIEQIQAQVLRQEHLLQVLRQVRRRLDRPGERRTAIEVLLDAIAMKRVQSRYFSDAQLRELRQRYEGLPPGLRDEVETEWPALVQAVRDEMARGTDPAAPAVQAIVNRWKALQKRFVAGNPGLRETMQRMYREEPELQRQSGVEPALFDYLRRARDAGEAGAAVVSAKPARKGKPPVRAEARSPR